MDKLIVNAKGEATISNDGATIMKLLDIVHPAAKTLVDIAKSQDAEVGDGTTSVVVLACEFLKQCKPFVEEVSLSRTAILCKLRRLHSMHMLEQVSVLQGVHPRVIIKSFRKATQLAVDKIKDLSVRIGDKDTERRELLVKCAATALSSKLIHQQKDFFAEVMLPFVARLLRPHGAEIENIPS